MKNYLMMTFVLFSLHSFAGEKGNGGDILVLQDDRIVLADPFSINIEEEPIKSDMLLSKQHFSELERIKGILTSFQIRHSIPFSTLITDTILGKDLDYFLVKRFPEEAECSKPVNYPWAPQESKVKRVACTKGNKTWIHASLFKKMNIRMQSLLLLHEGLRRFKPTLNDSTIFKITTALQVGLEHLNKQLLGDRDELTLNEQIYYLSGIKELLKIKKLSGLSKGQAEKVFDDILIFKRGGGLVKRDLAIDESNYLGIGTTLNESNYLENMKYSTIIYSNVCFEEYSCRISSYVQVVNSNFRSAGKVAISKGAIIKNSELLVHKIFIHNYAMVLNSKLEHDGFYNQNNSKIILKNNSRVQNIDLTFDKMNSDIIYDLVFEPSSTVLNLKPTKFYLYANTIMSFKENGVIDFKNENFCKNEISSFRIHPSSEILNIDEDRLPVICQ